MKVVLINDQLNPGGAEKVLVNTANLLHQKGIEVSVLLYLGKSILDEQLDKAIPVTYLHRKNRFDFKAMRLLKKCVSQADIVHVHSRYNLRYLIVCKMLVGIGKPKLIFQEHIPVLKLDRFTAWTFSKIDAYVAVLKSMCDWVQDEKLVPKSKTHYLPNIVATPVLNVEPPHFTKNKMVMVGNFMKLKNQFFALELVMQLDETYTLDIYGMVHQQDYYIDLEDFIVKNKLQNRVRLIQGVTNIYDVLGNYDFALHTSLQETGPLVLLEYMHSGLPFLTYATGDVATNLLSEIPELVINSFTILDWKAKIESAWCDQLQRLQLQQKMKTFLDNRYTETQYFQRLQHIYTSVLN